MFDEIRLVLFRSLDQTLSWIVITILIDLFEFITKKVGLKKGKYS